MEVSANQVWQTCLDIIRDNVSRQSFKTWFEPLKALSLLDEDGQRKLTIQLPSRFYYEWLEEHYYALLRKTILKVVGPQGRLIYHVVIEKEDVDAGHEGSSMQVAARQADAESAPLPTNRPPSRPTPATPHPSFDAAGVTNGQTAAQRYTPPPPSKPGPFSNPFIIPGIKPAPVESNLNPSYTFERFIEGDCNRLARSASLAIGQQPGATSFNPFMIYGGVGLGKTHLIQAIGNYALANHNARSVLYISSERFTNEFVQAIQNNRVSEFSLFYRQIDLLIVDDVQFFGGKEKTQEEFFHIFNTLHQSGKQIILSADRPPRDIPGIEERLLSRFQWGLTADVQPPEFETRIAILQRRAEDDGIQVARDVIEFVAHHVKSNIRELEGALIRLLAQATLHNREIDLPLAREMLKDLIKDTRINLTIDEIQRICCEYFDITEDLVRGKTRKREVVQARQVAMYFSKELTQHSLKTIGLYFGGRDHSTVIHANQSVENQVDTNPKFAGMMNEIRQRLDVRSR